MDIVQVTDYDIGRHFYESGRPFEDCDTEEQCDGWQDAAYDSRESTNADSNDAGMKADFECMLEAQTAGECIGWNDYWRAIDKLAKQEIPHATTR